MYDFIDEDKLTNLILSKVSELVPVSIIEDMIKLKSEVDQALSFIKDFQLQGGLDNLAHNIKTEVLDQVESSIQALFNTSVTGVQQAISTVTSKFEQQLSTIVPQLQAIDLDILHSVQDSLSSMSNFKSFLLDSLADLTGLSVSDLSSVFSKIKMFLSAPEDLVESMKDQLLTDLSLEIQQFSAQLLNPDEITNAIKASVGNYAEEQIDQIKDMLSQQLASPDIIKLIDTHLGGVISRYEAFVGQKLEAARNVTNSISNTVNVVLVKYEEIKAILDVLPNVAQGFTQSFKDQIEGQLTALMSTLPAKVMNETKEMLLGYLDDFLKSIF